MYVLGISAFYHDSAAVLIRDGKVIAAAEEERFSRIKHDNSFPFKAIDFCLNYGKIRMSDISAVGYYEKPLLKFERILETFVQTYPRSLGPFIRGIPEWLGDKIKIEKIIRKNLRFKGKIYFIPHHLSHAASSYLPSLFKKSAVLTIDGVGDRATTALWKADEKGIHRITYIDFPHSLGLLYSTFTSFLGFKVNNDEYKVMGLAAYGRPVFSEKVRKTISVKKDGSFKLNMKYFSFRESFRMWSGKFEKDFGIPRRPDEKIKQKHKDIAASLQQVFEECYFGILNHLYRQTGIKNLCIGGGVALNSLANGKIYLYTPFKKIYNFGPAGDGGAALGAALYVYHLIYKKIKRQIIRDLYFGSEYSDVEIEKTIGGMGLEYKKFTSENSLLKKTAGLIYQNKIVGWFQGRMEFGPRALGSRSILANPKPEFMKDNVNKIKKREEFRPFAGSVLRYKAHDLFNVPEKNYYAPFMNFCLKAKNNRSNQISAIVHKDGTCRIQTVDASCGRYYRLIKEFYKISGIPCVLNTSFNVSTEPIVENPSQAIRDYLESQMDNLAIGNFLLSKD